MKKLFTTLVLLSGLAVAGFAQHCSVSTTNITPGTGTTPGLAPPSEDLPCMVIGQNVSDTIYFTNFTSFNGLAVQSLTIDTIGNLPAGTCWVSNKANNTFGPGENGIIYVSGLNTGAPGQYKLRIIVTASIQFVGTIGPSDAESLAGLRYYVRSKCSGTACPPLDTVNGMTQSFIPYAACAGVIATVTPSGHDTICPGSSATLTANAGTGYTYRWSNAAHSTTQSITVTTSGSYQVTVYHATDSAVSAPTVVVVGTTPSNVVTASRTAFCQGDSAILSASPGYTYQWTGGGTTSSIVVHTAGSYTVTVTNSYGCTAVSSPQSISVNASPSGALSLTGPASFCQSEGDTVTISAASGSGLTYGWSTAATTQSIRVTTGGTYTVTITNQGGCHTVATQTITVLPNPTVSITRTGSVLTSQTASSYQWYQGSTLLTGETNQTLNITQNGNYSVSVTGANGCTATSNTIAVTNVGISDVPATATLRLYPNPTEGIFTLEAPGNAGSTYEITDALGRIVSKKTITAENTIIDVSAQHTGTYYLTVKSTRQTQTIRFVIAK